MKSLQKKTVLILSYIDYPYYVGLTRRISGISKVLTTNSFTVRVIAPLARSQVVLTDDFSKSIKIDRFDLRCFGVEDKFSSKFLQWLFFSVLGSIAVVRYSIKDHAIIQYQSIYSAFPAVMAKILLRATIIGDDVVLISPLINKIMFKLTDCICTPSRQADSYAKQLGKQTFYVPNGVNVVSSKLNLHIKKNDIPTILFVGALTFDQNYLAIKHILNIASNLDTDGFNFNILIVGGPLKMANDFMNHPIVTKSRVKFLGQLSFSDLSTLYSSASIGLLPFFCDIPLKGGQRTKALEYLSNGLLVVSGTEGVKGISGLVDKEHFLKAESPQEMVTVLKDCLSHPEKVNNISINGANFVNKHHSWGALTNEYIEFLKNWCLK